MMNDYTRILIILFAVMFFFVLNTEAFAALMTCTTSSAGVTECVKDGVVIVITR